ncbi:MAG TPA: hypothetical protein VGR70_18720 [Stellaceae bacterium]|nr:hypothetical protein [Stellaceae bacterium]
MRTVFEIPERRLPKILEMSDRYQDANELQKKNLKGRFQFIEQITLEIAEWLDRTETDFDAFLDRIELHLAINQGAPLDAEGSVSAWLIHTSWTFETSPRKMRQELSHDLASELNRSPPSIDDNLARFNLWLNQQNSALIAALADFRASKTIDAALANLIAIDALLLNLLTGATRARLNFNLAQEAAR